MAGGDTVLPLVLINLPLDVAQLRVTVFFLGAINIVLEAFEEAFEEDFGLYGREILSVDSDLNESTNLWLLLLAQRLQSPILCFDDNKTYEVIWY